ncbi:MAG: hypothetical protein P4L49_05780 [Desulfosporosinus sp.]|nr:hypothetical protein [Desulfosporosinus sp.]
MGTCLLRGITIALLVTVLTLFAGIVWGAMGLGGLSISRILDIGLMASCLVGGYRTAKESGMWWMGGAAGAGYVTVGTLLLALFLPIRSWGFIQILAEGAIIGLVAGAVGIGGAKKVVAGAGQGRGRQSYFKPSYEGYGSDERGGSEFEWVTEENFGEKETKPKPIWLEGPEAESQGICRGKRNPEKSSDVEWSWDREDDKVIALGAGDSEPLLVWEPERVRNDVVRNEVSARNRTSLKNTNENEERDTRPWWEE